jgi:protein TonB
MFDHLIESKRDKKRGRRWVYFLATSMVWMMTFTAVIIAGIVVVDAQLGESVDITNLIGPPPPLAPKKSGKPQQQKNKPQQATGYVSAKNIPDTIAPPQPRVTFDTPSGPPGDGSVEGGSVKGSEYGVLGGGETTVINTPPPPLKSVPPKVEPQPQIQQPPPQKPIRSVILQGTAINRVQPTYPYIARVSGVSGAVVVEVTIDEQGNVAMARVLSGHLLLRDVCLNAARGWKWRPTMLNGSPVKVIGTITFNFQK